MKVGSGQWKNAAKPLFHSLLAPRSIPYLYARLYPWFNLRE
jgi:hypothetical protein